MLYQVGPYEETYELCVKGKAFLSAPFFTGQASSMDVKSPAFQNTCVNVTWVPMDFPHHNVRCMTWLKARLAGWACVNMVETFSKPQSSQPEE